MASLSKGYQAKIGLDISDVDKKVNSLSKELKTIDKSIETSGDSATLAAQKFQVMSEKVAALSDKLQTLESARGDVTQAFKNGEISAEDMRAYEREVENTRGELNTLIPVVGAMKSAFELLGEGLQKVTGFLVSFAKESITVGKAFESSMSQVAATMAIDKLSDDFQALSDKAKEAGASTRYTASEAADALNYLALAGYNTEEAINSLDSVLNLAQAGGMELARASDMITDTISALHLTKDDMDTLIDQMAKTAQRSNTSVSQLGDALLTLGGTAANIATRDGGLSEINMLLGVLADNGIKASEGGTHLRNILLKMSKPTKNMKALMSTLNLEFYDLEGNLRPIPDIFLEMKEKMDDMGMTNAERDSLINKAFNPTDIAAVNALLGTTSERFSQLQGEIEAAAGSSDKMAETMNANLDGALRTLTSAKEAVEVEFYEKMDEPLANMVGAVSGALQDIAGQLRDAEFGAEFTEALQKIADAVVDVMPQITDIFKRFAEEIVPKLGDVATKIVDITADKVLPKLVDLLEWIIDHGTEIETAIKLFITAMATKKVMDFTNEVFNLATQFGSLATAGGNAATGIANATTSMTNQTTALTGSGGLIAKANLYVLALEAVVAAALLAKDAIEKQTEAMIEQKRHMDGFTDTANDNVDRYAKIVNGENDQSLEEMEKQLEIDKAERARLQEKRKQLFYLLDTLQAKAQETGDWDDFNNYLSVLGFSSREEAEKAFEETERELQTYDNLIHQEQKLVDHKRKVDKDQKALDARQNEAAERNRIGMSTNVEDIKTRAQKEEEAEEEATQAEIDAFAENLETQEELWDKKYHWDKKNQEDYWAERKKWLEENKVDTKEWWESWNEVEAHFAKSDKSTQKDVDKSLEEREKKLKESLDSYKTNLKYLISAGELTEAEANELLAQYLDTNLDKNSDLYKKEMAEVNKTRQTLQEKADTQAQKDHEAAVKTQKEEIKKRFKDLENQAKAEGWSDRKLYNEKMKVLNEYKRSGTLYNENLQEVREELAEDKADILKKEREADEKLQEEDRKAREKQAEKDAEEEKKLLEKQTEQRKKILEEAQKEAQGIIESYYKKNYDELASYGASGAKTVTDSTGKERYLFSDYEEKLKELKAYQANLKKLEGMNLSPEHLQEIFSMDLDTRMKYISELVRMSGDQRARYLSDYNKYTKTSKAVAQQTMKFQADEIKTEVKDKYDELVKDGALSGEEAAAAFVSSWNNYIKNTPLEGLDVLDPSITQAAGEYNGAKQITGFMNWFAKFDPDKFSAEIGKKIAENMGIPPVVVNLGGQTLYSTLGNAYMRYKMNTGSKT